MPNKELEQKRYPESIEAYEKALEIDPENPAARGHVERMRGAL